MQPIRLLTLIATLVMITTAVQAQPTEQLVLWSRYDLTDTDNQNAVNLNSQINAFEAATGIEVVYEQVAWDQVAPKLAIAAQTNSDVPDVVATTGQHIPSLLDIGALLPLDDALSNTEWLTDLNDKDADACLYDEGRYCVVHTVRSGVTYYRDAAFPDGFPQTAAGWLEVAPQVTGENSVFTTFYAGRSYSAIETLWYPMIASNGGTLFDADGKPAWATEAVAEVVAFNRQLLTGGHLPQLSVSGSFFDAETPWLNGEAASFRGASWSPMFVPGLKDAVDSGEVVMTGGVDFGSGPRVFMMGEAWVVPSDAANPTGAATWIDLFMQPENLSLWAQSQFGIPTLPAAADDPVFDEDFFVAANVILNEQGIYMQRSPFYLESVDALAATLQELLLNPNLDSLTRLEASAQEILNRHW